MSTQLTWYFDFISPFAYLQFSQLQQLPADTEITFKPILLAGLLNHWQSTGPAEVPPKRLFTYQHCAWLAKKMGRTYKMPPAHPFNSLLPLRLAIASQATPSVVKMIFEGIWKLGLATDEKAFSDYICSNLAISDVQQHANQAWVKQTLRQNTEEAIQNNVFGVPTTHVVNPLVAETAELCNFWGLDSFNMLLDFLAAPSQVVDGELKNASRVPIGVQRKQSSI
jgi:2-hydroxychromene-2-carboxylate isomerase